MQQVNSLEREIEVVGDRGWQRGSLTLEATIVFPVFMMLLFCLINFTNICGRYVAMDHAVSETAKDLATHLYPVQYVASGQDQTEQNLVSKLIKSVVQKVDPVTETLVKRKIADLYPLGKLQDADFHLVQTALYNPWNGGQQAGNLGNSSKVGNVALNQEDIALVVEYKVKVMFPFVPIKEITLSNTAVERAWLD